MRGNLPNPSHIKLTDPQGNQSITPVPLIQCSNQLSPQGTELLPEH